MTRTWPAALVPLGAARAARRRLPDPPSARLPDQQRAADRDARGGAHRAWAGRHLSLGPRRRLGAAVDRPGPGGRCVLAVRADTIRAALAARVGAHRHSLPVGRGRDAPPRVRHLDRRFVRAHDRRRVAHAGAVAGGSLGLRRGRPVRRGGAGGARHDVLSGPAWCRTPGARVRAGADDRPARLPPGRYPRGGARGGRGRRLQPAGDAPWCGSRRC